MIKQEVKCDYCQDTGLIDETCYYCSGSGEGQHDGSTCKACNGNGEYSVDCPNCSTTPTEDYYYD